MVSAATDEFCGLIVVSPFRFRDADRHPQWGRTESVLRHRNFARFQHAATAIAVIPVLE